MSVLIKGAKMPKNCQECDSLGFSDIVGIKCPCDYSFEVVPNGCPLFEVPPHGDLIDRDKIWLNDFEIVMCNGDYKEALQMQIKKILDAPTVIEMEE